MIPDTVAFTDLELNPREMMWFRVVEGPFPASWAKLLLPPPSHAATRSVIQWTLENVNGRFGVIDSYPNSAIYFEDTNDAILFRLKDGHEAWKENTNSF